MECKQTKNLKQCTCSYGSCSRKGLCCECVSYHLALGSCRVASSRPTPSGPTTARSHTSPAWWPVASSAESGEEIRNNSRGRTMRRRFIILALLLFAGNPASATDNLTRMEWKVDGVAREALVYAPATAKTDSQPGRVRLPRPRRHDEVRRDQVRLPPALAGGHRRLHAGLEHAGDADRPARASGPAGKRPSATRTTAT